MTTDYVSVRFEDTVGDAVQALKAFDGDPRECDGDLSCRRAGSAEGRGAAGAAGDGVPGTHLSVLAEPRFISCHADSSENEVAELFDKYNLQSLPVVDSAQRLVGIIQADHVIAFLRQGR